MKKHILLNLIFGLFISAAFAQGTSFSEKAKELDDLMNYCYNNQMLNGAVLVAENGNVIYKNAFGIEHPDTKKALTTKTAFYLASVSKQFTTMAIMILKEKKKLSYDDKLSKYFSEFPSFADSITIKHLMTHTSGIPDHFRLNTYKKDLTNDDVLKALINHGKIDFTPGDKYSYSNGGYVLLALIVEKASGIPFHEFMDENIFQPLEMKNTLVFDESKPEIKHRAAGMNRMGKLNDYDILTSGAGGIFSTVEDLFLWDQALYGEKLVSQKTLEEAFKPTILNGGKKSNYGFGWGINEQENKKIVQHTGGLAGYRTIISRDITNKRTYIILTSKGNAINVNMLGQKINSILNEEPYELPKIPISNQLANLLITNGAEDAVAKVKKLLENEPGKYQNDEMGINALGYAYMADKDYKLAKETFKSNIELNPNSSNVYDSYGELLMNLGDTLESIKNYKKSVELNPANTNGIKILEKMGFKAEDVIPKVTISIETMDKYIGKYEIEKDLILEITRKEKQLIGQATGQPEFKMYPASSSRFYLKEFDAQLTFNKNDEGEVVSVTLHRGGDTEAKKIE